MPRSQCDLQPHQHLALNPSDEQQTEEEFSFEELQRELQGLQQQLLEHGRNLFGGEVPPLPTSPRHASSRLPPPQEEWTEQEINEKERPYQNNSNTRKISKNERYLKAENQKLQKQLAAEREELHRLRALNSVTETKMASRIENLEDRLKLVLQNEKKLEKRRAADAEGWRAEFTAMRHRLQSAEHRQRKLILMSSINDEDHKQTVLTRHNNKLEKLQQQKTITKSTRKATKTDPAPSRRGGFVQQDAKDENVDVINHLDEHEVLQECMGQLSEELNALKSALGTLEQQFYK